MDDFTAQNFFSAMFSGTVEQQVYQNFQDSLAAIDSVSKGVENISNEDIFSLIKGGSSSPLGVLLSTYYSNFLNQLESKNIRDYESIANRMKETSFIGKSNELQNLITHRQDLYDIILSDQLGKGYGLLSGLGEILRKEEITYALYSHDGEGNLMVSTTNLADFIKRLRLDDKGYLHIATDKIKNLKRSLLNDTYQQIRGNSKENQDLKTTINKGIEDLRFSDTVDKLKAGLNDLIEQGFNKVGKNGEQTLTRAGQKLKGQIDQEQQLKKLQELLDTVKTKFHQSIAGRNTLGRDVEKAGIIQYPKINSSFQEGENLPFTAGGDFKVFLKETLYIIQAKMIESDAGIKSASIISNLWQLGEIIDKMDSLKEGQELTDEDKAEIIKILRATFGLMSDSQELLKANRQVIAQRRVRRKKAHN